MNSHARLVLGVVAGFVFGVLVVGSAFAIPAMMRSMHYGGDSEYSMMGYGGPSAYYGRSFSDDMYRYMDSYRGSDGSIDFDRMHDDLNSSQDYATCR